MESTGGSTVHEVGCPLSATDGGKAVPVHKVMKPG